MDLKKTTVPYQWKTLSFLRLFLPMILGLVFEYFLPSRTAFLLFGFSFCFTALIFCNSIAFKKRFRILCVFGAVLQISFIFLGMIIMHLHQDKPIINSGYENKKIKNYLSIQIISDPV